MRNQCQNKIEKIRILSAWALVALLLVSGAGVVNGGGNPPQTTSTGSPLAFGPFQCTGCTSKVFTHHFLAEPGVYVMVIQAVGVGNAKVILNGQVIFPPAAFPANPAELSTQVVLKTHNTLKLKVWENGPLCTVWVSFIPLVVPAPAPQPAPQPAPADPCTPGPCGPCGEPCPPVSPPPAPAPCDPCLPPAPPAPPAPAPCDPCLPPAPPAPPAPVPCDPCCDPCVPPQPDPCYGYGCGPTTTVNQVNQGDGSGRDNAAQVAVGDGGAPGGLTVVNQLNQGNGNERDNVAMIEGSGGSGAPTIVNQLNLGHGDDRTNLASISGAGDGCGPGGCTQVNQLNIGNGNGRFNLAEVMWAW